MRELSDNCSVGMWKVREDEGYSFSGFSFSKCIIFYFENQNNRCDKQQNICFNLENLILKYVQERVFLHGYGDYEKITEICGIMIERDFEPFITMIERKILAKIFKAKGNKTE